MDEQPGNRILPGGKQGEPRQRQDLLPRSPFSPLWLFIVILIAIFTAEVTAMLVVRAFEIIPYYQIALLDAGLITLMIFPVLYVLSFRPLLSQIAKSRQVEESLRAVHDDLERRVQESTEELRETNLELQEEIAERKRVEQQLERNNKKLNEILDSIQDDFYVLDRDWKFVYASRLFTSKVGKEPEDFIGNNIWEMFPKHVGTIFEENLRAAMEKREVRSFEIPGKYTNAWYRMRAFPSEEGITVLGTDITERKQAEEALQLQNAELETARAAAANEKRRLEAVMESLPVGVAITDLRGGSVLSNPAYEEIWGRPRPEVHSLEDYAAYHAWWTDTGRPICPEEWASAQVVQKGRPIIGQLLEIERFDGSHAFVINSAAPVRDSTGAIVESAVAIQDVTELRRAEQALRAAHDELELRVQERTRDLADANRELVNEINDRKVVERQLQIQTTALEAAANGIIITGRQGTIRWANPAFLQMTGYALEEVLGQNPRLLKSGQHEPEFYRDLWSTILAGNVWRGEITNRRKDGSLYIEEQTITPLVNQYGEISNFIAIKQDISERKRIEEALDRERSKLRQILDTMPDGIYIVNRQYEVEYINPVIEREFGSVAGRACYSYFHDRTEPCPWCKNEEVFSGKAVQWEWYSEKTKKTYDLFDTPMINADGSISKLELFHDITHRKQTELELERRNLELQAMGEAESEQRQVAESLRVASQALTQSLDLDHVLRMLMTHICPLVHADVSSVILLEGESQLGFRAVEEYEEWTEPRRSLSIRARGDYNPFLRKLASTQRSLLISDTLSEPYWEIDPDARPIRNCLFVPIVVERKIIGVVALGKAEARFFTGEHVRWAEVLVRQAAVAIQNAWLFEQVRSGRERLQSLSRRLVELQEMERRFVARELHDQAGQTLTSLILELGALEREAGESHKVRTRAAALKSLTDGVLEDLHRLAINLRPASLDHLGLVPALEQLTKSFGQDSALQIRFKAVNMSEDDRLPQEVETALYRIAQEALTNVIRHASAQRADVVLERRGNRAFVLVEDDGKGFDVEGTKMGGHLGLLGIEERAQMLGGKFTVESVPGKGTTLVVEIPYADSDFARG